MIIIWLCLLEAFLVPSLYAAWLKDEGLDVDLENPVAHVDKKFLSIALDAAVVADELAQFNMSSLKLLVLARGLASSSRKPEVFFRLGGSDQDHYFFDPVTTAQDIRRRGVMYVLNATELSHLCNFVEAVGWNFVIGLNSLLRRADGSWDHTNAVSLMEYAQKIGCVMQFELGNEPDLYESYLNLTIPPSQLAKDFLSLRKIIDSVVGRDTLLLGPDIATLTRYNYFSLFLSAVQSSALSAVTFHHYYSASVNITVENFTSIAYLDTFIAYCELARGIITRSFEGRKEPPIWIGETSSTYGGGSKEIGQSFAAGFVWLDKLGLAAQFNISVIIRQSLVGGWYSLLMTNYDPAPDYWTTLLYKRLVGNTVLKITGFRTPGRAVRVYAHCAIPDDKMQYKYGDIVIIALNLNAEPVFLTFLESFRANAYAYVLTSASGSLDDKVIKLNGNVLKMVDEETLPDIGPVQANFPLPMPSFSYGFFVITELNAPACMQY